MHEILGRSAFKLMSKEKNRHSGARFHLRITLTVSVTLMLLVLGLVAFSLVAGRNISRDIHQQAGFVAVLSEEATQAQADSLAKAIGAQEYALKAQSVSTEQVMERWHKMVGEDVAMPEVNPFLPEIEVAVKEQWAEADSLKAIAGTLEKSALVSRVDLHSEMIDSVNSIMHTATVVLIVIGAVLLLICLALINNTVRLTVYSQRFVINTMKLVGATNGFIRRPFVLDAAIHGAIAGGLAVAILCGALWWADTEMPSLEAAVPLWQAAWVMAGVWMTGIILCTVAALLATNKYLKLGYDDMFN